MRINRSLGAGRGRRRILTSLFASVLAVGATVLPATPAFAWSCKVNALQDPTDSQIQTLLDAGGPSSVTFYGFCDGNFVVSRAMTVLGASGAEVQGDGGGTVFDVEGPFAGSVTFRGLKISGGNGAYGSGLQVTDAAVVLDRVTLLNNDATQVGGGVFVDPQSTLTVTNSSFRTNSSYSGGAIYAYGARVTITSTTFQGNWAWRDGGAISADNDGDEYLGGVWATDPVCDAAPGALTISRSTFSGNYSRGEDGGAIELDSGSLVLTGSTFSRNSAETGGALALQDDYDCDFGGSWTITSSTFTSNSAAFYGGAIAAEDEYTDEFADLVALTITGSRFTGNRSNGLDDSDGGAMDLDDVEVAIASSSFTSNVAAGGGEGGAIWMRGNPDDSTPQTITNSTFTGNRSADTGGAIDADSMDLDIVGSTFTRNVIVEDDDDSEGGAIAFGDCENSDEYNIIHSRFVGNSASEGGALRFDDCNDEDQVVNITGSTFTGNVAREDDGGALSFQVAMDVTVRGSTFSGNRAPQEDGGAVNLNSFEGGTFATDASTVFTGNSAREDGGAVYAEDANLLISGSYTGNSAGFSGGAIFLYSCESYLDNQFEISAATIERNTAWFAGGGIYLYEDDCDTETDLFVYDDDAAMFYDPIGTLDEGPVSISYNKVLSPTGEGGGIYVDGYQMDLIEFDSMDEDAGTITIQRNSAADGGGMMVLDYYEMYLGYGVLIAYNTTGGVWETGCSAPWDETYVGNVGYDYSC